MTEETKNHHALEGREARRQARQAHHQARLERRQLRAQERGGDRAWVLHGRIGDQQFELSFQSRRAPAQPVEPAESTQPVEPTQLAVAVDIPPEA